MKTKTQSRHTPGKWLVMGNQRNGHFDFVLPQADDKDFQANARLIAAAPELLQHAKQLLRDLEQDFPYTANELQATYELRKAISNAEGR